MSLTWYLRRLMLVSIAPILTFVILACTPIHNVNSANTSTTDRNAVAKLPSCEEWAIAGRLRFAETFPAFNKDMYVPNQLILSGVVTEVQQIVTERRLIPVDLATASPVDYAINQDGISIPYTVQLFQVSPGSSIEQIACEINRNRPNTSTLFAEPNYFVSPAMWIGAGSAQIGWSEYATNWTEMPKSSSLGKDDFKEQWAFGKQGISLTSYQKKVGYKTGKGTTIVVFDTSPSDEYLTRYVLDAYYELYDLYDILPLDQRFGKDISPHGLYVAKLANAVAPNSKVHLIRVTDQIWSGDLFTFVKTIHLYIDYRTARDQMGLNGTVMNISLGVHYPQHPAPDTDDCAIDDAHCFGLPSDVSVLRQALLRAKGAGAVIVAAAGNDSFLEPGKHLGMEVPAAFDFVIGVGANAGPYQETEDPNADKIACFSNAGEVFAPGGNGYLGEPSWERRCDPPIGSIACKLGSDELCIISFWYSEEGSTPLYGYAYWAGTSFATPLVSGLAALLLEDGLDPQKVHDRIITCAKENGGKVDIKYTMENYLKPNCK